jgi:predicted nucleic acid-binding protein
MKSKIFIDSNIWIYAFLESEKERTKQQHILSLLENLSSVDTVFVSVQVINEFHWILSRKYRIDDAIIKTKVTKGIAAIASIAPLDFKVYQDAYRIRGKYNVSFWDSLIVASALDKGCAILYSEDMQHELMIDSKLKIVNPFS